jgi:hypothetical protein
MQQQGTPSSHRAVRECLSRQRRAGFEYVDYDGLLVLLGKRHGTSDGAARAVAFRAALDNDVERVRQSMLAAMGLLRARAGSARSGLPVVGATLVAVATAA